MNVLIACEFSQRVCIAFRELGHNAYSCDIINCTGGHPEWHIKDDVTKYINGKCEFYTCDGTKHSINGKWDLLIAHPPCTFLSNAGARWLYAGGKLNKDRYAKGIAAKQFFMLFYNADCDRIAIENPLPNTIFNLPKYSQVIQPYMFYGEEHPYTKKTLLWLKGLPLLQSINSVTPIGPYCPSGSYSFVHDKSKRGYAKRGNDAMERSKTFTGIAKAMAEQWGGNIR